MVGSRIQEKINPLSMMWYVCAEFLGHPWVWSDEIPNVFLKCKELEIKNNNNN